MEGERSLQSARLAEERDRRVDRRVEPLVWIAGERVGVTHRGQLRRCARSDRREGTVGAIDVDPHALITTETDDGADGVDRPGPDGPRGGHDGYGPEAPGPILGDHVLERVEAHPVGVVGWDE